MHVALEKIDKNIIFTNIQYTIKIQYLTQAAFGQDQTPCKSLPKHRPERQPIKSQGIAQLVIRNHY